MFAEVGATASAKAAGQIGLISEHGNPIAKWEFDYAETQLSGTVTIELELSVGVGFSGLASVGLRGAGYLSYCIGFEAAHANRPLPHHVIAGGVEADVVVQLVVFKWSGKLWGIDDPSLCNSWKDDAEGFRYGCIGAHPANAGLTVGVSGIGQSGGVRPTLDALIAQDVFSDPRQKIVVYKGKPYLFRILSVDYGDEGVRSRLAAQQFDLGRFGANSGGPGVPCARARFVRKAGFWGNQTH